MVNSMKKKILFGLCVAFGTSVIPLRAEDTPAQAAARAALEQKWNELNSPQTQPASTATAPSTNATTNASDSASANAVTAPAATYNRSRGGAGC